MSGFELSNYHPPEFPIPCSRLPIPPIQDHSDMTIPTPRATAAPTADPVAVGIGYGWGDLDCQLRAALTAATELAIAHLNAQGGLCGRAIQAQLEPTTDLATVFGWSQSHGPADIPLGKTLLWQPLTPEQFTPHPQVFYTGPCLNQTVQLVMDWYAQQPPQRVFLLGSLEEKSQQLCNLFLRDLSTLDITIAGEMELTDNDADLWASVARAEVDQVIDTRTHGQAQLLAAISQGGFTAATFPILFLNLPKRDYALAAGHLVATHYNPHNSTSENQAFCTHWGLEIPPDTAAAAAYAQVLLWAQAVELAQSFDPDAVRTAAYGQSCTGPQGLIQIHPNHHLSWGGAIARCTPNGELETLWQSPQPIPPLPGQVLASEAIAGFANANTPLLSQITQERLHRQQLQDTLRDYGLELHTLFTTLTETVLITDIAGCILRILPTRGPLHINADRIGQGIITLFPVEIVSHLHEHLQQACNDQANSQYEYQETEGGRWFAIDFAPIAGREQVIWVIRDITEQKLMELERRASVDELRQQFAERTKALIAANDQLVGEIVERQQAETALQAVLDAVPGIVSWISADLRYLGVNRHLAAMFGLEPQEFVGQDIGFLNASDEFMGFVRDFFESDRIEDFQEIVALVEGRQRHYLIVMQKYDQGRGAFSVGIDITERIEAESGLARSKEQLQAVLEAVPGIVSWISADLHYMGVNRHLAHTFDLRPADFIGQPIGFLQASGDFNQFVREFFASPAQDDFREVEAIVEGETRNYLIAAQKYDNGQAAFTVGIDVTERQRAIEDLARSKDQLQAVLEAVPGIVSWIGSDLRYMGVNRQLARTFNREPQEFVGQDIGFLQASSDFNTFVREFFASPAQDDFREVEAIVKGEPRNYLIASQKYDDGKAAFAVGVDVTERQQALKALQRAEEKYRMIFENAVEGIFQTTPEGRYLSANPALARIYGYDSPDQLVNQLTNVEADLYVDPKQRQIFVETLTREGNVVGFEAQIRRRDRAIRWISENARAVHDDDGTLLYYEGTVEDITDRKQAEMTLRELNEELENRVQRRTAELQELNMQLIMEIGQRENIESALRTSEAELRALFAAMTDIITVFNHEGRYEKIVSTNSELIYTPEEDLLGRSIQEILPPEQAALFLEHIRRALNEDQIINLEYSLTINHEDVWFAATISPLPDRCVMWVARNITERRKVLDALSKAEAKYRSIFENAAEGIFQTTTDGRYISANPALVKMYGYDSFAEMAARIHNIDQQIYVEQGLRQQFREQLERDGVVTGFKTQVRRKDGTLIWTSENARLVCDHEGQPLYYEGTVADITKQKAAEDALHLEQQRSEQLLLNVLPKAIAERLKRDERAIAERYDQVTILFADIVDFTSLSAQISPTELVEQLNDIFSAFDQLAEWYNLEKIKTIGDAYMVAGGITATTANHAPAMADMALDMQLAMTQFRQSDGQPYRLRMGIHTGPAVGGVIGIKKFIYDLWGDTVNVASRMEAQGIADMIQVTEATYQLIKEQFFLENRGEILVKGRGLMNTYWLRGRRG